MPKVIAAALALLLAAPSMAAPNLAAGRLDLDIYASGTFSPRPLSDAALTPFRGWTAGDPRDARGGGRSSHLSHVGYAALGAAGLATSVASGGVAPAIGFGAVALWQAWQEWALASGGRSDAR